MAFALATGGGADLRSTTWSEIVLVLIGCAAAILLLLLAPAGRGPGTGTVLLFAALTVLTALSILWSVAPDSSWLEANRLLSLLAVTGSAVVAARLAGERWAALLGGLGAFCVLLSAYALVVKVFPGTLDRNDPIGRLKAPFDYWNATGLIAALGLAPILWAGARREGSRILSALSVPAVAVLVTVLVLSYSRSALLAAGCAVALWFAVVPLRLRGAAMLAVGGVGGAALSVWALNTPGLTRDHLALAARSDAGHGFGLVLVVVLGLCAATGLAIAVMLDRTQLSPVKRRQIGIVLWWVLALVPLGGVLALALSSRGLTGQISHAWSSLTDTHGGVGDTPGRLVELANSRPRYWREGLQVGAHSPLHGTGAASYAVARLRFAKDTLPVRHAHSYPIETFADLGVLGLAVNLALLTGWGLAVRRTLRRGSGRPGRSAEGAGLLTLLCTVVAFGAQSAIDWTWSIPGAVVPVLLCVGWLVGRGPLSAGTASTRSPRRRISVQPLLGAAGTVVAVVGLLAVWVMWQPLRASQAENAAVTALSRGDGAGALSAARSAVARNPLAVDPLYVLSDVRTAVGDAAGARSALEAATRLQPDNPDPWSELGRYELAHGASAAAAFALAQARELDPTNAATALDLRRAQVGAPTQ